LFKKKDPTAAPVLVPAERVKAIAAKGPPAGYKDFGGRKPRAARKYMFKQAFAIMEHGERVPIAIKSLNATGLRVEHFQNRSLGDRVLISESSIPLHFWADVVWERDGAAGLRVVPEENEKR
jgi:hypothetical protein